MPTHLLLQLVDLTLEHQSPPLIKPGQRPLTTLLMDQTPEHTVLLLQHLVARHHLLDILDNVRAAAATPAPYRVGVVPGRGRPLVGQRVQRVGSRSD